MKRKIPAILLTLFLCAILVGCFSSSDVPERSDQPPISSSEEGEPQEISEGGVAIPDKPGAEPPKIQDSSDHSGFQDSGASSPDTPVTDDKQPPTEGSLQIPSDADTVFDLGEIPAYSNSAYVPVNGDVPFFDTTELSTQSMESYSPLDELGRCGVVYACIGKDIMPTEERGSIGMVKPSGWHTVRYDDLIADKYLYNRCHLIGYQLTGENANLSNLITGTRYLNIEGMLPFENMVADYVESTGNHVAYRVTPVFEGNNLLATGVLMEAYSVEDQGGGICFCIFAYNVQPGIEIDYATGDSRVAEVPTTTTPPITVSTQPVTAPDETTHSAPPAEEEAVSADYFMNTNTTKFHYPSCSSVSDMKEKNKKEFTGSRDELINMSYHPCGRCHP